MASDEEITQALKSLLVQQKQENSLNDVVQQVESKLRVDLSNKHDFIQSQIQQLFLLHGNDHSALQQPSDFHPSPSPKPKPDHHSAPQYVAVSVPKQSTQSKGKRRGGPGGLNKLCGVSPKLQTIVGQSELPRTEIVKQLWAYIRKHNLQDPRNKRKIICNDDLRLVFETDSTDMFKMNKLLAKHIISLEPAKESAPKKVKVHAESGIQSAEPGPSSPSVIISEALANFFSVDGREMLQSEVLRRIWEYIKLNSLEDPLNSMVILCDANLKELFGCESISALGIPKVLAQHLTLSRS